MISIDNSQIFEYTSVPNAFIDSYLAGANTDQIKVYLYFLRRAGAEKGAFEIASVCEALSLSEAKVKNALQYWEGEGLLELFYSEKMIAGIRFIHPARAAKAKERHRLTAERVRQLIKEDEEAKKIIFLAETYFGRPLTPSETADLLFFHDKLGFSAELCDYLLDYSVTRGAKNMNYPKTVALAWHAKGIRTVDQAKADLKGKAPEEPGVSEKGPRSKNAKKNTFLDFDQHDYDLKELARKAKE